jgi:hypothetical protein
MTEEELRVRVAELEDKSAYLRRLWLGSVRAVLILGLVLVVIAGVFGRHISHNAENLRDYQLGSCRRGDETRRAENLARYETFLLYRRVATAIVPGTPLAAELARSAARKEWRQPVDCEAAIDHPNTYTLGRSVRFSDRRPPLSALPAGSHL